jgi:hypothetical protein
MSFSSDRQDEDERQMTREEEEEAEENVTFISVFLSC